MAIFKAQFSIDSPAFDDACTSETVEVLKRLIAKLEEGDPCVGEMEHEGRQVELHDSNGTSIGSAWVN